MKTRIFNLLSKFFEKQILEYCLKNFPLMITTKTRNVDKIYVKKGKIRQWRTFVDGIRNDNFKTD